MSQPPQREGLSLSHPYHAADDAAFAQALGGFSLEPAEQSVVISGDCGRCQHPFSAELALAKSAVVPGAGITGASAIDLAVEPTKHLITCACTEAHSGRPDSRVGCGAMAIMALKAPTG